MIELEKENIAPYLSILMGVKSDKKQPCDIHPNTLKILKDISSNEIVIADSKKEFVGEIAEITFTPYRLLKAPSWLINHEALDVEHHVFVSFNVNNYFGFYFSEKGKKDEIRDYFNSKIYLIFLLYQ